MPRTRFKKRNKLSLYGKYGILNQPFDNKLLFKNLEEARLDKSENIMSDLMIKIIEKSSFKKKIFKWTTNIRKNSMKKNSIKKWEKILIN